MRIRLFLGADPDNNKIAARMFDILKEELSKDSTIVLTDENPDVIHFIGAWTASAVGIAKDAMAKFIATVHTPLGSLCPWQKPSSANVRLTSKCSAIISAGQMEQELLDDGNRKNLQMILNPVVTSTTTNEKMAAEYKELYRKIIKSTDDSLWDEVENKVKLIKEDDAVILNICKNLLYAQHLTVRKNLPLVFLKGLAELFVKSDYDEDRLGEVLKLINLFLFTQHLEFVMQESAQLTEGFMPLPMKADKVANNMLTLITDYQK